MSNPETHLEYLRQAYEAGHIPEAIYRYALDNAQAETTQTQNVAVARDFVAGDKTQGNEYTARGDIRHDENIVRLGGDSRADVVVGGSGNQVTNIIQHYLRDAPLREAEMRAEIARYLNWVIAHNSRIKLTGIKRADGQINEMSLDDVYVPLQARLTLDEKTLRRPGKHPYELAEVQEGEQAISLNQLFAQGERLVVTGGPGCGKSTVLMHIAWVLALAIGQDQPHLAAEKLNLVADTLPLPIFIPLNRFADHLRKAQSAAQRTLTDFIAHHMIERNSASFRLPADFFQQLLEQRQQVVLLLDGLDEIPEESWRGIVAQKIEDLVKGQTGLRVIVTCRTAAYNNRTALGYDFREIKVQPLDEAHVAHLVRKAYPAVESDPADCAAKIEDLLEGIAHMERVRQQRTGNKERLITSPLMVRMLLIVHMGDSRLPEQRAELYHKAVDNMILSQHHRDEETRLELENLVGDKVLHNSLLQYLAFQMHSEGEQVQAEATPNDELMLVKGRDIEEQALRRLLTGQELFEPLVVPFIYVTKERGTLMEERLGTYRFIHLGFQEFLAARYMAEVLAYKQELARFMMAEGRLAHSWWREPFLLLVGYLSLTSHMRAVELVRFLVGLGALEGVRLPEGGPVAWAGAELAGTALLEWPKRALALSEAVAKRLGELVDGQVAHAPVPARLRANVGMVLGQLGDPRAGVGVRDGVPDLAWGGVVPAGKYTIGGDGKYDGKVRPVEIRADYQLAKYPVTYAQFQCFVEADDFGDAKWWEGMLKKERQIEPNPSWPYANHPRVKVSWYQAVAFVRWLSVKLGYEVRLPHEYEWEVAARYNHGRTYPWGEDEFDPLKTNTHEGGLGQTTAVGLYPSGRQPHLNLYDMSGNVWEWCQNKYEDPTQDGVDGSGDSRVWRGGSWYDLLGNARAAFRLGFHPYGRGFFLGFRLVRCVSSAISS
ncbi:MAG: SUMF1/EgtB/PvdO family nonheme iron enzyme [Chloroflexi bacterium]|nr:SUMF1/EgtB/PvdO family nonheme iron enzyme [Chloroflexota bacterium]